MKRFGCKAVLVKLSAAAMFVASGFAAATDVPCPPSTDPTLINVDVTVPSDALLYQACVSIQFDSVVNLTPDSLGLTAQLIDPASFAGLPAGVTIDPNFPVLISIEPPVAVFRNGYETNQVGEGNLDFLKTYDLEIHTDQLTCSGTGSTYRLFKAPHGSSTFADVTNGVYSGSVRARGRGGAFSQFVIANDSRATVLLIPEKLTALVLRLGQSTITGALLQMLTDLLKQVLLTDLPIALLTGDLSSVITDLDTFVADVLAGADAGQVTDEWTAGGSLVNDAGELVSQADSLIFSLLTTQGSASPVCSLPPPL